MNHKQKLIAFLREEDGQTTAEYVLILLVIVTIAMQFKKKLLAIVLGAMEGVDKKTDALMCDGDTC